MKKLFTAFALLLFVTVMMAVPAKRGVWKTIKLSDGTEMRATLQGDEFGHYWKVLLSAKSFLSEIKKLG